MRVVGETGDAGVSADGTTNLATAEQPQQPAAQAGDAALVAQKAVLYEEPVDSAKAASGVTQISAAVTWSYVTDPANGPAVVAKNLDVRDRGLDLALTIHRQQQVAAGEPHLIEVAVNTTGDWPGKGIRPSRAG